MKWNLLLLVLAVVACRVVWAQNDDLPIPEESDNQFPPDNHAQPDEDIIEGSGAGPIDVLDSTTEALAAPKLEEIESASNTNVESTSDSTSETPCPKTCVCSIESESFVVDCSGLDLTDFPTPIDTRTTTLNLQNNKLTEIPREVSELKNLKILNANNNSIMELVSGSVSELPELVTLKLANNRLIEYPKDLKNSLSLTKLEELDLGGNDMRTVLNPETFSNFQSLRTITLPTSTDEIVQNLCESFKETLESVCTESCKKQIFECPDAPQNLDEDLLDATLPGMIALNTGLTDGNVDPDLNNSEDNNTEDTLQQNQISSTVAPTITTDKNSEASVNEFSLRTAVNKEPEEKVQLNSIVESPKETAHTESDVNIGANTSETTTGGVDKSIIGIIVAGMIVVVAGIVIKKNWSSIRKRFSSTPRSANERSGGNVNGTSPEEVPLQDKDKSPV